MNRYRRFITSSVAFTFIIVGVTGVIFKFFFATHLLVDIHGWLGVTMVMAAALHIAQNWQSLRKYLADKRVYGLLLPVVAIVALVIYGQKDAQHGVSPREVVNKLAHAHAADIARVFGKDEDSVMASMRKDGLSFDDKDEPLAQLAERNHIPPERVLVYFVK